MDKVPLGCYFPLSARLLRQEPADFTITETFHMFKLPMFLLVLAFGCGNRAPVEATSVPGDFEVGVCIVNVTADKGVGINVSVENMDRGDAPVVPTDYIQANNSGRDLFGRFHDLCGLIPTGRFTEGNDYIITVGIPDADVVPFIGKTVALVVARDHSNLNDIRESPFKYVSLGKIESGKSIRSEGVVVTIGSTSLPVRPRSAGVSGLLQRLNGD